MTQYWRSEQPEDPGSAWLRGRYIEGSVYVLNLDPFICSPDLRRGLNIEWKHIDAANKSWRATRELAMARGWWSARFEYQTDTGHYKHGQVTEIWARFCAPDGTLIPPETEETIRLDSAKFDRWVTTYIANGWKDRIDEMRRHFEAA